MTEPQESILSLQKDSVVFPPPPSFAAKAFVSSPEQYTALYDRSIKDSHGFWLEQAVKELKWFKKPTQTLDYTWDTAKRIVNHTWFADYKRLRIEAFKQH